MSILFLQIWGAVFYLLNKVFFSMGERAHLTVIKQKWLIWAWLVYIIALPAWVIVFISKNNWIAAAIEGGAAPAMIAGLYIAWRGKGTEPRWLDHLSKASVVIGLGLSLYDFGGITSVNQILELGIAAGFLLGTYQLAKDNSQGYLWLILGNIFCAILMGIEGFILLMLQQLFSLIFVIDAYCISKKIFGTEK